MVINIFLLILGFILLIKGSDIFIDGSSSTAQNFKISKILIGLTIVAFGTSAPEFAISITSLMNNSGDMVLGNVIGSCIMNILLMLGIASIIRPIKIKESTIKNELPLYLLISTLLVILFIDVPLKNGLINQITRSDALVIILFFTLFIYYLTSLALQKKEDKSLPKYKLLKSLLFILIGLVGIIIGSNLVVNSATFIAHKLGMSDRLISLTIIAFGTSLPELVTTIVSSFKNEQDLLIGNIIGSNIFNICVVLGIPVLIFGTIVPQTFQIIDLVMIILSGLLLFIFALKKRNISKMEGIIMLVLFVIYYTLVFIV